MFTDLICVEDERCIDVRELDGEFHELQDLSTTDRHSQQVTYSAPEGEVCAVHDVQLTDKDGSNSTAEEPEDSILLEQKQENGQAKKEKE